MAKAAKPVPNGFHTITPQLTLDNAAQTIEWYKRALGAEEVYRSAGPDGKIMHAELNIGDSRFLMNDTRPGSKGPKGYGGSPASLWIYVENSDALFNRAVAAKRQPGSAFKPFVYLTALERGLTPDTMRDDRPIDLKGWRPENYTSVSHGEVRLREALNESMNQASI